MDNKELGELIEKSISGLSDLDTLQTGTIKPDKVKGLPCLCAFVAVELGMTMGDILLESSDAGDVYSLINEKVGDAAGQSGSERIYRLNDDSKGNVNLIRQKAKEMQR